MTEEEFLKKFGEFHHLFNIVEVDCYGDWHICFNKDKCEYQEGCKIRAGKYNS